MILPSLLHPAADRRIPATLAVQSGYNAPERRGFVLRAGGGAPVDCCSCTLRRNSADSACERCSRLALACHPLLFCMLRPQECESPILGQATRQNTDMSESTDRLSPF